jgi:hypothetical protein
MSIPDKEIIEREFGPLWSGADSIAIADVIFTLDRIKRAFDLESDDLVGIDLHVLPEERYAFRFYDGDDRRVVVFVFESDLTIVSEYRAHIADWLEDEYYQSGAKAFIPEEMVLMLRRKILPDRQESPPE